MCCCFALLVFRETLKRPCRQTHFLLRDKWVGERRPIRRVGRREWRDKAGSIRVMFDGKNFKAVIANRLRGAEKLFDCCCSLGLFQGFRMLDRLVFGHSRRRRSTTIHLYFWRPRGYRSRDAKCSAPQRPARHNTWRFKKKRPLIHGVLLLFGDVCAMSASLYFWHATNQEAKPTIESLSHDLLKTFHNFATIRILPLMLMVSNDTTLWYLSDLTS